MIHASSLSNITAIALAVVVVIFIAVDVRRDIRRMVSGRNVVLMSIIAWFLVEAIQLPQELQRYTQSHYNLGILCVSLAMAAFLVGYHSFRQGCPIFGQAAGHVRVLDDPELLWRVVLLGALVGFAPIAYYSGLQLTRLLHDILGMRKTWGGLISREQYGDARSALLMLEMFIRGVGPFAILLLLNRNLSNSRRLACMVIAAWPLLRAFGSGTRSSMISTMLPALAVLFWLSSSKRQRRMVWIGLACTPLVYLFMAAMVTSRSGGSFSWEHAGEAEYVGHEMFRELLFITERVPDRLDYQWGYFYYVELINPVPRFLWEGKPKVSVPVFMSQLYGRVFPGTDRVYVTTHPGLIGEMYLNFGVAGILSLSFLGGWLVRGWDHISERYRSSPVTMIFYSAGLATLIVLGRSFSANLFYKLIAFVILTYVIHYFISGRERAPSRVRKRPAGYPVQPVSSQASRF